MLTFVLSMLRSNPPIGILAMSSLEVASCYHLSYVFVINKNIIKEYEFSILRRDWERINKRDLCTHICNQAFISRTIW